MYLLVNLSPISILLSKLGFALVIGVLCKYLCVLVHFYGMFNIPFFAAFMKSLRWLETCLLERGQPSISLSVTRVTLVEIPQVLCNHLLVVKFDRFSFFICRFVFEITTRSFINVHDVVNIKVGYYSTKRCQFLSPLKRIQTSTLQ
jgi:hypothetical protein